MPVGRSLHIGLNAVNAGAYGGWAGRLAACEADANDMRDICAAKGFETTILLTPQATSTAVLTALDEAAAALVSGDLYIVTYSGHGGQMADVSGDESDRRDETWVLYDRQVLDDELAARWTKFAEGVRIVVLSDSCHSGTVIRAWMDMAGGALKGLPDEYVTAGRFMPADVNERDNQARADIYATVAATTPSETYAGLKARVLLLSGCQDNQTSSDGERNGLFTGTLRSVYKNGYWGGYSRFLRDIKRALPPWQSPNYLALNDPQRAFDRERPFEI